MTNTRDIETEAETVARELCEAASIESGQTVIVGCSTSEIAGSNIGSASSVEIGVIVFNAIDKVLTSKGVYLAAQCCEHLNRAIVIESRAAVGYEIVNAVPKVGAGGAFASAAYELFSNPVLIEEIQADAGLDIGGTLIGMHLKRVAVPLRLNTKCVGKAVVSAARTRPKLIGGSRAFYNEHIL